MLGCQVWGTAEGIARVPVQDLLGEPFEKNASPDWTRTRLPSNPLMTGYLFPNCWSALIRKPQNKKGKIVLLGPTENKQKIEVWGGDCLGNRGQFGIGIATPCYRAAVTSSALKSSYHITGI